MKNKRAQAPSIISLVLMVMVGSQNRIIATLAARIQARFKARGANLMPEVLFAPKQRRSLPEFARPEGSPNMKDLCVAAPGA